MATVKQTKALYKKLRFHIHHLRSAIHEAKEIGVIREDEKIAYEETVLNPFYKMANRIDKTTETACASAFKEELLKSMKGIY